jgi:hypothetical protein
MFRPVTITHPVVVNDGKPFDAYRAEVYRYGRGVYLSLRTQMYVKENLVVIGVPKNGVFSYKDDHIHRCVSVLQYQLAQALNPPIEVTQAVLKAMDKVPEAKYLVQECSGLGRADKYPLEYYTDGTKSRWYYQSKEDYKDDRNYGDSHPFGEYIQADCPLALQVLLGFTTKGVPKDE